ncbi:3-hydroxyisobutyrate dehydrogenase [Endozoicomonas montiporae]|uniref:3-hydroxyisobutyrate dehydrogenase n=2 Tax=Endozoicomonas montiporae TaxID=1027273 RepID=A0A081NB56_9GAMM|nr:3-hydroxyisobutyrate dehydrogenase [Endozoicomonas montiporae]AMO56605.1 3-hydroxyisobutyrate dehydrogenase [Endozoicomonas montiporae CL-33]KEQ15679.1 3-hydroxyisobutyrate dehydrogenase [Endozoicomonas montiporae]
MAKVAFIGLGNMGGPMAANLLKAGHNVVVFDLVSELMQQLVDQGATSATSALAASEEAEFIITMLPAGKHVEMVYLGDSGLLSNLDGSPLLIDCSTIDSQTAKQVAAAAAEKGFEMIDAPVSGGVAAAQAGTLSFMCGGAETAFLRAEPVLKDMGKNLFHAGAAGAGQTAKICNNMLLSVLMTGTAEALQLGVDHGLDPKVLSEIMLASSGRNWSLEVYNPYPGVMENAPSSHQYQPGFMVDLMVKDLGLAMTAALESQSAVPMGSAARNLYMTHKKKGHGRLDFSSILQALK